MSARLEGHSTGPQSFSAKMSKVVQLQIEKEWNLPVWQPLFSIFSSSEHQVFCSLWVQPLSSEAQEKVSRTGWIRGGEVQGLNLATHHSVS